MPYRFRRKESVQHGLQRIAREEIEAAIREANDPSLDPHYAVHQVRRRCKKIRGLLRLVGPQFESTYRFENAWFRDAARELSPLRDAQSILQTYNTLADMDGHRIPPVPLEQIRSQLVARREKIALEHRDARRRLSEFTDRLQTAYTRIDRWTFDAREFEAIRAGLEKTYRRGRKAFAAAYHQGTASAFHDWRKRVKYHGHHLLLLERRSKKKMIKRRESIDQLGQWLGDEHDLTVLETTLRMEFSESEGEPGMKGVLRLIEQRRRELRKDARPLGCRLFAPRPQRLANRFGGHWEKWRGNS